MSDKIVEIIVELLTILAIATKAMKHGRFGELDVVVYILPFLLTAYSEKYSKKFMRNREIEDSLQRLGKLTQEEARMASAEQLKIQDVDDRVQGIDSNVRGVDDKLDQANRSSSL